MSWLKNLIAKLESKVHHEYNEKTHRIVQLHQKNKYKSKSESKAKEFN